MKTMSTLTVNGETYTVKDPNAVTAEDIEGILDDIVEDVLAALPTYNGEVEEV